MGTRKPLVQLMPEIIGHYNRHIDYLEFNNKLYRILEGQVRLEVEDSLRKEILSASALSRALQRIPAINMLKKAVDKLSKVYIQAPLRLTDNETDMNIMQNVVHESNLNNRLVEANRVYNAQHTFALEPFVKDGKHMTRVLAAQQFLPFSDDPEDPTNMTVFIKLLGNEEIRIEQKGDDKGNRTDEQSQIRRVDILALYSDDEFMIVDSSGNIRQDKMLELGITSTKNPFGRIPFVVGNRSSFELVPFPNQMGFDISILVPKLLTDLNYAAQFMSHSIIYTKNADLSGQSINPDAIVDLGDRNVDGGEPEIGTIDPKVDIERILKLIEFEMSSYFSSIGIKTSVSGSMSPGKEESGVSKAIDEGDASAEKKVQTEFFREVEARYWELMSAVRPIWIKEGRLLNGDRRNFTDKFIETFRMKFAEIKPLKSRMQLLDELKVERELKAISRKQMIRTLHPDFTEDQINKILDELDSEAQEEFEKMMMNPMPSGNRSSDGTFGEGNEAGSQQDPEANLKSREPSNG